MGYVARFRDRLAEEQTSGQVDVVLPPYATGTVHHDAVLDDGTVVHHHQVFEAGRLVAWEEDDAPGPWALVRPGDPLTACPTGVAVEEDLTAVSVRVGEERLVLPPLDDCAEPALTELPFVPDASTALRFELTGSPVGTVRLDTRYQDGRRSWCRVVGEWPDPAPGEPAHGAPGMAVTMTWRNYLRMRSGEATALEAIEQGGTVDARWTLLLLLHGLVQEPEYVAAYRSLPRVPAELGWWGEVAPWIGERTPT